MNLFNIQDYSDQEIFNHIMDLLIQQNAKSQDAEGICLYRGDEGRKCAVGLLMDEYNPAWENVGVTGVIQCEYPAAQDKINILEVLQSVHDLEPVEEWPNIKINLAKVLFEREPITNPECYNHYTFLSILAYQKKNGGSKK